MFAFYITAVTHMTAVRAAGSIAAILLTRTLIWNKPEPAKCFILSPGSRMLTGGFRFFAVSG